MIKYLDRYMISSYYMTLVLIVINSITVYSVMNRYVFKSIINKLFEIALEIV